MRVEIYTRTDIRGTHEQTGHIWYIIAAQMQGGEATAGKTEDVTGTENRAELTALRKAMERITKPSEIHVYTRSSYVAAGWEAGWIRKWEDRGWMTAKGKPVRYMDEWKALADLTKNQTMVFHVKEQGSFGKWLEYEMGGINDV